VFFRPFRGRSAYSDRNVDHLGTRDNVITAS
jgi:hypothetical protein